MPNEELHLAGAQELNWDETEFTRLLEPEVADGGADDDCEIFFLYFGSTLEGGISRDGSARGVASWGGTLLWGRFTSVGWTARTVPRVRYVGRRETTRPV